MNAAPQASRRRDFTVLGSALPTTDECHNRFSEIDCLRSLLPADALAYAEERAAALNLGADRVLITSGTIDEETYLRRLSHSLGIAFEPFDDVLRTHCTLTDERLIESARIGLLPLTDGNETRFVLAPCGKAAQRLAALIPHNENVIRKFRLTTSKHLNSFVLRYAEKTLLGNASDALKQRWPDLSAAPGYRIGKTRMAGIAITSMIGAICVATFPLTGLLSVFFLFWLSLRILCACKEKRCDRESIPHLPDAKLPIYSIVAALYDEADSVDSLLCAIERLDYPHEKLDVILAVEADDTGTLEAIQKRRSQIPITVIASPAIGPRTKPKALNVALPFARGAFLVVYDAEDRPEPDQLRRALHAFRIADDDIVCVQARLCIDNTNDSWLTRLFTAEYAGHFDAFLGGLAKMRLPLPLGGSSNHFRTSKLSEVGGWDSYNVTEDADLGMRLARFGYRSDIISSTTYEEAPARFGPWLRQRTRWFKGWMQTWIVHMRHPLQLKRDLGLIRFATFQLIVGGNALAALVHPFFVATVIFGIFHDGALSAKSALYGVVGLAGYLTSIFLGCLGLARRRLLRTAWVLMLAPFHWLLLSLAAWRALYQLLVAPYVWEKTKHGLAKTSRRSEMVTRSLLSLERHLREMKETGALPTISDAQPARSSNFNHGTRVGRIRHEVRTSAFLRSKERKIL